MSETSPQYIFFYFKNKKSQKSLIVNKYPKKLATVIMFFNNIKIKFAWGEISPVAFKS